jgi:hypothetical protein
MDFFDCVKDENYVGDERPRAPTKYTGEYKTGKAFQLVNAVFDGQKVYAPFLRTRGVCESIGLLQCSVACAAGDMARVVNDKYGVDTWFELWQLRTRISVKD